MLLEEFDTNIAEIEECFALAKKVSNYIPMRSFIIQMLGTIYSNNRLALMGIVETNDCMHCQGENQTRMHLMWECPEVKAVRDQLLRRIGWATSKFRSLIGERGEKEKIILYLGAEPADISG